MIFISKQISKKVFSILTFLLLFFLFSLHSYAEMEWKLVNQLSTCTYNGIACNDKGLYVAVGSRGIVRTSYNLDWKDSDSTTDSDLFGCTYGGGKFVAVGEKGTVINSADGIKWNKVIVDGVTFKDIAWNNGLFVAVGNSPIGMRERHGYVYKSSDGVKWTLADKLEGSYGLEEIKCVNEKFVAIGFSDDGSTEINYSADGESWTTKVVDKSISDIIWDDTRYVAMGMGSGISVSTDLNDWTTVESNLDTNQFMTKIIKLNGKYLILASVGNNKYCFMSSEDLKSWSTVDNLVEVNEIRCFYINKNHMNYALKENVNDKTDELIALGVKEETVVTHDGGILYCRSKQPVNLSKAIWNGKEFLAIGNNSNVFISSDGCDWKSYKVPATISDIVWNGKCYTAFSTIGTTFVILVYQSVDGKDWTQTSEVKINYPHKIFYFDNRYFITGEDKVLISADAKEWREAKANISEMAWDGKCFIGVRGNTIFESSDGITWNKQKLLENSDGDLENVIWNGKEYMAFTYNAKILESEDGQNWREKKNYNTLRSAVWDGKRFVFTGFGYSVKTMDDSGNLFDAAKVKELEPKNIAWNGEKYIIVGDSGFITECVPTDIIKVKVNGTPVAFDVAPITKEGRNLVPLRAIFDALGASVEWDGTAKTITGKKDGTVIKLKLDSNEALINGEKKTLDVPATSIDGRTMVPARFIAESLGASVEWDDSTKTVTIEGKK